MDKKYRFLYNDNRIIEVTDMKKYQRFFRIAAILNLISSSILFFNYYSLIGIVSAIVLWHLSSMSEEELQNYNVGVFLLAFSQIFINFIASIFVFLAYSNLSNGEDSINPINGPPVRVKKVVNPEMRRIDILLKLGVGMVLISGILFATTSWSFVSDAAKAIFLLVFGSLFLCLSLFTEIKLKLYRSSYMYWIVSMSFYLFSIIALLYFGVLGSLSYDGVSSKLAYAITCFTVAGLCYASYLKLSKEYLLFGFYGSAFLVIYNFLAYFPIDESIVMIILSSILLGVTIFSKKDSTLFQTSKLLSMIMFVFIIRSINGYNEVWILLASILNIATLVYLMYRSDDTLESIFMIGITYILLFFSVYNFSTSSYASILLFCVLCVYTLLIKINTKEHFKLLNNINYGLFSIASLIIFVVSTAEDSIVGFIISLGFLFMNILASQRIEKSHVVKYASYIEPVAILISLAAFFKIKELNWEISFSMIFAIATIVYIVCYYFYKENNIKKLYLMAALIGTIASIQINIDKEVLPALLVLVPTTVSTLTSYQEYQNNNPKKAWFTISYIILLISIYNLLKNINILVISDVAIDLIFLGILVSTILLWNNEIVKKTNYFAIIIPLLGIINYFDFNITYKMIMISILLLYLTFIIVKFLCKTSDSKNIVGLIGVIVAIIEVMFETNVTIGIYIGIVGIIVILLGYHLKELKSFFVTGIIITILNILIQLRDLWETIPFWLYLLIGGLAIIGFVTYKETNKK